jgi:hypothetical protein
MFSKNLIGVLIALGLLAANASAEVAHDEEVITPPAECSPYHDKSWVLTHEARLADILKALAALTCERFFVPRVLVDEKLVIDIGSGPQTTYELHTRVQGALRAKGINLETAPAYQVSRVADASRLAPRPSRYVAPAVSVDRLDKWIKCANNRCTVTRELFDALLGDPVGLSTAARLVPSIAEGKPNGFKLYAIRPDSYFGRLGFQNGDTVVSVAGYDISSPDKVLEIYTKLRGQNQFKVELLRRGEKVIIEYVVK